MMIVAIDSDSRIQLNKGEDRPYNTLMDRKKMLMSLEMIDVVFSFNSDKELINLVKCLQPDVMMVGEEYRGKNVIGSQYAKDVKYFRRIDGYSTTKILQNSSSGR